MPSLPLRPALVAAAVVGLLAGTAANLLTEVSPQAAERRSGAAAGTGTPSSPADRATPGSRRCWSGEEVRTLFACPPLVGVRGLRWVFPGLLPNAAGCRPDSLYDGKRTAIQCRTEGAVLVTYSEYRQAARLRRHYVDKYGAGDAADGLVRYGPILGGNGRWTVSQTYAADRRFAVTVTADSRDRAVATLEGVRMRSERVMLGQVGEPLLEASPSGAR